MWWRLGFVLTLGRIAFGVVSLKNTTGKEKGLFLV
jgi:hypothetical protein